MPKALITGITGQDGSYLADLLLKNNFEVYGTIRRGASPKTFRLDELKITNKINLVSLELTELANVLHVIKEIKPDHIYNLAAQSFVADSFVHPHFTSSINYLGVLNILEAIKILKIDSRFYQASTSEMYGEVLEDIQNENTPFNPISPYAISKLASYHLVKNYRLAYNMHASNGILFNHESEFRGREFVTKKISTWLSEIKKNNKGPIPLGSLSSTRDWGYAPEYVRAMKLIIEANKPDDFVVSTNTNYSVRDFLRWCCEELDYDVEFIGKDNQEVCMERKTGIKLAYVDDKYYRPSDVKKLQGSFKKISEELNWKPQTFAKDIARIMVRYDLNKS